jgi:hypothetical protein
MGQQQLLLLVLAAVIVGTAVVIGINMFAQNSVQANQDAVAQDVITIVARAQAWFKKPTVMGGGGHKFTGLSDDIAGFAKLGLSKTNANGSYSMTAAAKTITVVGTGIEDGNNDGDALTVTITAADSINVPAAVTAD